MANLSVRNIDEQTVANLRVPAAHHGVSMEEEIWQIQRNAAATPDRLGDLAVCLFSPAYSDTELSLPERQTSEPLECPK